MKKRNTVGLVCPIIIILACAYAWLFNFKGIYVLGENGNGSLMTGEVIMLNDHPDVTDEELRSMLEQAITIRNRKD